MSDDDSNTATIGAVVYVCSVLRRKPSFKCRVHGPAKPEGYSVQVQPERYLVGLPKTFPHTYGMMISKKPL